MKLSKLFICITVLMITTLLLSSCANRQESLVIYTTFRQDFVDPILDMFYEETGIRAEVMLAGTGELISRIRAEAENPQADILWGGTLISVAGSRELFADFQSVNEPYIMPGFTNTEGPFTSFNVDARVLMINTEFIGDIEIRGYADLLNPALRGQISLTDPAASASAFDHLVNKLYAMGNGDPNSQEAWDFIEAFVDNLDGVMLGSSSAVFNGVAGGEYLVGLTFEEAPMSFIQAGAPVAKVHMQEGSVLSGGTVTIVNNAPNMSNAQRFVNFVTGFEVQNYMEQNLAMRTVRTDVPTGPDFVPMSELRVLPTDVNVILSMRDEWLDRFRDIRER